MPHGPNRRPRTDSRLNRSPTGESRQRHAGGPERLQRILARAGLGSRRGAEELIRAGRVRIGERVATLGDKADPSRDQITVDGVIVPADPELVYMALNKPAGVTTSLRDRHAERTIADLVPTGVRVFPVGRLDRDSEGLLLLTNDGELAHRLQHPSYGVEKEYLVDVQGEVPKEVVRTITKGVLLEDGPARALRATTVARAGGRSAVAVVMGEGRKREVRRIFAGLGFPVLRLVRTRIGSVKLADLSVGSVRDLGAEEVRDLYRTVGLTTAEIGSGRGIRLKQRSGPPMAARPAHST